MSSLEQTTALSPDTSPELLPDGPRELDYLSRQVEEYLTAHRRLLDLFRERANILILEIEYLNQGRITGLYPFSWQTFERIPELQAEVEKYVRPKDSEAIQAINEYQNVYVGMRNAEHAGRQVNLPDEITRINGMRFGYEFAVSCGRKFMERYEDLARRIRTKHDQLAIAGEREPASGTLRGMSQEEANIKAIQLAGANPEFVKKSQRDWAKEIGCSVGLVAKLPLWIATMERTGRGKANKGPGAVSLTDKFLKTQGMGESNEILNALIREQEADAELSPLEPDPVDKPSRKVRSNKRL